MKKQLLLYIVLILSICSLVTGIIHAADGLTLVIHGNKHTGLTYTIEDGEILIPARTVITEFGGKLEWYGPLKILRATFDDNYEIRMQIDNPSIHISPGNSDEQTRVERFSVPPRIVNGQTMVPVRFFAQHFGFFFKWDETVRLVKVYKPSNWVLDLAYREELAGEELVISSTKKVPYSTYVLGSPDRLVIDFKESALSAKASDILWDSFIWKNVRVAQHTSGVVRVVITLNQPVKYEVVEEEDDSGFNVKVVFAAGVRQVKTTERGISIKSTGEIGGYDVMTLSNPERLVVDIPEQTLQLMEDSFIIEHPLVSKVRTSQLSWDPNVVRIVLDLNEKIDYNILRGKTAKEIIIQPKDLTDEKEDDSSSDSEVVITPMPTDPDDGGEQGSDSKSDEDSSEDNGYVLVDVGNEYSDHELVSISIHEGVNQRVVIKTSTPVTYSAWYQPNPDRLVVDLHGAILKQDKLQVPEGKGIIKQVRMHQHPDKVRVVFDLTQYESHKALSEKRTQKVEIGLGKNPLTGKVIVIDPGHGGMDPGAVGIGGVFEKLITLDIGLKVRKLLDNAGATVIMTRDKDVYPTLGERVDLANQLSADIFVSIHCNSFHGEDPGGTETFVAPKNTEISYPLAEVIQIKLVEAIQLFDRGVKSNDFYVLNHTTMPSALVEVAFMTQEDEVKLLKDPEFQDRAALGIYEGILAYFTQILESESGEGQ